MSTLLVACLVLGVPDGDSLKVKCPARVKAISVRLAGIDAPELEHRGIGVAEQPGGRESKDALMALCLGQPATVRRVATDRHGRALAKVKCNGVDVSVDQVRSGQAWAYLAPRGSVLPALQANARAASLGLWALPNPIKPSEWRKGRPDEACPKI